MRLVEPSTIWDGSLGTHLSSVVCTHDKCWTSPSPRETNTPFSPTSSQATTFFSTHGNILKQVLHPLFTLLSGAKMCADIQHLWSPDLAGSRRGRKIRLECAGCSQSPLLRWQERSGCDSSAYGSYINPTHSPLRLGESCSEKFKSWQFISRVVTAFLYSTVRNLSFVTPRNTNIFVVQDIFYEKSFL